MSAPAGDNRRLFAMSGNNPDPLIELGDNALRCGCLEKGDVVFAARREHALPRRLDPLQSLALAHRAAARPGAHFGPRLRVVSRESSEEFGGCLVMRHRKRVRL